MLFTTLSQGESKERLQCDEKKPLIKQKDELTLCPKI